MDIAPPRSSLAPAGARSRESAAAPSTAERGAGLWAIVFPVALLMAMGALFLRGQIYPLARVESLALFVLLALAGIAAGFVMRRGGRLVQAVAAGILLAVFFNHAVEWPVRDRYSLSVSFLVGFALSWLLGRNFPPIGAAGSLVVLLSTILLPAEPAVSQSTRPSAAPAATAPPPVVHLVLDGHIGIESLPIGVSGSAAMKTRLREFYAAQGFRLFGGAFSRHTHTRNSIPDLMNFGTVMRDGELITFDTRSDYIMKESEYFRRMVAFGYRIHVYQSDVMDFCTPEVTTCTVVRFKSMNWIADSDLSTGDKLDIVLATFANRATLYQKMAYLYNSARDELAARTGIELSPVAVAPVLYTQLSSLALAERLTRDMPQFGAGDLVFAHVMLPHFPFALDAQCRHRGGPETWSGGSKAESYGLYLEQVECTTRTVASLVAATTKDAHIVVHGDHGARLLGDVDRHGTLFAVRRPNQAADYVADMTAIDELLVRELLQPLGVPVPPLALSGPTIKRKQGLEEPLELDPMPDFVSGSGS